jgi:hypothetical protein
MRKTCAFLLAGLIWALGADPVLLENIGTDGGTQQGHSGFVRAFHDRHNDFSEITVVSSTYAVYAAYSIGRNGIRNQLPEGSVIIRPVFFITNAVMNIHGIPVSITAFHDYSDPEYTAISYLIQSAVPIPSRENDEGVLFHKIMHSVAR